MYFEIQDYLDLDVLESPSATTTTDSQYSSMSANSDESGCRKILESHM